jgi:hypothetical protein
MGARKLAVNDCTERFVQDIRMLTSKPTYVLAHQLAMGARTSCLAIRLLQVSGALRPRVRRVVKKTAGCPFF